MKIFLTGASGFLGRHLISYLEDSSHEIVAMTRSSSSDLGVTTHVGDIVTDDGLVKAMRGCDWLVHAAGRVSHDPANAQALWDVHVKGSKRVIESARSAGIKKIVYISTSGVVAVSDDPNLVANETSPTPRHLIKNWPYYRSKLYAEEYVLSQNSEDLPIVSLNPSLLLGPGDAPDGPSTSAIRLFLEGRVPLAPPGGLSFVDVRDIPQAIDLAFERGVGGQRYLLGSANMTFTEFYQRLSRISGLPAPTATMPLLTRRLIGWVPGWKRFGVSIGVDLSREDLDMSCHTWYLDHAKAHEVLGWLPRDPQATLEDTVDDLAHQAGQYQPFVTTRFTD